MKWEKKCENCIHFEVCAYVSHQLPACEDYAEAPVRCKDCIIRYNLNKCPMCFSFGGRYCEFTQDDGFCDRGERSAEDAND